MRIDASRLTLLAAFLMSLEACAPAARYFDADRTVLGPAETSASVDDDVRALPMFAGNDGRPLGWADLMEAVAWADVIILGEQHDDEVAHAVQREVVADTFARWQPSALTLEMLERDEQLLVSDYFEGIIDAKQFARLTNSENWGAKGRWHETYQRVIDAARTNGGRVVAANAPRRYVRLARIDGYERLASLPSPRQELFDYPSRVPKTGGYRERFWTVMTMPARPEAAEATEDPDEPAATVGAEATDDVEGTERETMHAEADDTETTDDVEGTERETMHAEADDTEATDDVEGTERETMHAEEDDAEATDDVEGTEREMMHAEADDVEATDDPETETSQEPEAMPEPHVMTDEEVESIFRSQLVWDTTMAASIAKARYAGAKKVVHLVGQFHSDFEGGTVTELRRRLPNARVLVVSLQRGVPDRLLDEDRGRADVVIYTGERPEPPAEDAEGEGEDAESTAEAEPAETVDTSEPAETVDTSEPAETPEPATSQPAG